MNVTHVIGYLFATKRKAIPTSQKTLAFIAELHPMALSKIERGTQGDIGINTFVRIADALCEDPGELLNEAHRIHRRLPEDTAVKEIGVKIAGLAADGEML
jgi:transcriptional regulator with XRE-family HTH domain